MREIKFRAWDGEDMLTNLNSICLEELRMGVIDESDQYDDGTIHQRKITVMQYTGIKDMNGKEIYEGDIVRRKSTSGAFAPWYTITWYDIDAGFRLKTRDGKNSYNLEVIGNKYEGM